MTVRVRILGPSTALVRTTPSLLGFLLGADGEDYYAHADNHGAWCREIDGRLQAVPSRVARELEAGRKEWESRRGVGRSA